MVSDLRPDLRPIGSLVNIPVGAFGGDAFRGMGGRVAKVIAHGYDDPHRIYSPEGRTHFDYTLSLQCTAQDGTVYTRQIPADEWELKHRF